MPTRTDTLAEKLERVEEHLVGLWRFRELGRVPMWCATYVFEGNYYDVSGKRSPGAALDAVHRDIGKLRKASVRKRK